MKELLERFVKCAPKEWRVYHPCGASSVKIHLGDIHGCVWIVPDDGIASGSAIMAMLAECKRMRDVYLLGCLKTSDALNRSLDAVYCHELYELTAEAMTVMFCDIREAYLAWEKTK
jgi:hypothetical protein